jgi:hypothetical protein
MRAHGCLAVLVLVALAACHQPAHEPPPIESPWTHALRTDAAFYTDGPQQARPPDGTLERGLRVRIVEDAGSYVRVVTEDERKAYVARDALASIR